jgi:predicted nucleotidyltransferase component of viral defense system
MTQDKPLNVAASVRQRLLNIIRETGDDANLVWTRYATERLLYRLSISEYAGNFILKGAMLFTAWTGQPYRPTVDMDFLGHGVVSSEGLADVFRNVCAIEVEPDGLEFDANSVKAAPIREEQVYQGQRVTLTVFLGKARILIQVDVGFGDVVTPKARMIIYPTLLDFSAPRIRAYPRETVVAEKLQAMVVLGIANSRMKDFYDVWLLSKLFAFDGRTLCEAVGNTFKRRSTPIPDGLPLAFTDDFRKDMQKQAQWRAFVRKAKPDTAADNLDVVINDIEAFLMPVVEAVRQSRLLELLWAQGGHWSEKTEDR